MKSRRTVTMGWRQCAPCPCAPFGVWVGVRIGAAALSGFVRLLAALLLLPVLSACSDGESETLLTGEYPVVYVERPLPRDENTGEVEPDDLRDPGVFRPGARLLLKTSASPTAPAIDLVGALFGVGERYDARDVSVNPEGTKLLFALRGPYIEGADDDDQPTWNIWEYDLTSRALRRVIGADVVAEEGQDIMPTWLADGRILFASTRQRATRAVLVDEGKPQFSPRDDGGQDAAYTLHVMRDDGTDIRQITTGTGSDFYPTLLMNGRILFARQARVGGQVATHLYTVRPDGRDLAPAFGGNSHYDADGDAVQFTRPLQTDDGRVLVMQRPNATQHLGGTPAVVDLAFSDTDQRLDLVTATGGLVGDAYLGEMLPARDGRYADAVPLRDGSGRWLVSWSACRVQNVVDPLAPPPATPPRIRSCVGRDVSDPTLEEAEPIYGVFVYSPMNGTRLPVVVPREGMMFDSLAVAAPHASPAYLYDGRNGIELNSDWIDAGVGVLDIRSVYDFDGAFGALGSVFTSLDELMDPAISQAADRPARFLRLEKAVEIPDDDIVDLDASAFGVTTAFGMRELLGYVPVQPDGSVRVMVTASVPFTFSVVDATGARIGPRHNAFIQLMPGEERICSGCHVSASGLPHGRNDSAVVALHAGATGGVPYANTKPTLMALAGETMAQLLARVDASVMKPRANLEYTDAWTDPLVRTPDVDSSIRYADLTTAMPATVPCQTAWTALCRTVIHYETHLQPLWEVNRGANTCINCHVANAPALPAPDTNQLDLSASPSNVAGQLTSYRELLGDDRAEQVFDPGTMSVIDVLVPDVDDDGNPIMTAQLHASPLVAGSARASTGFFPRFASGGDHAGRLSDAELRLIAEWVDMGAQYYNDPFAVP